MDDKEKMFDQYGFSEEEDASSAPDFGSFMNKVEGINTDSLKTPADPETTEESQLSAAEAARRNLLAWFKLANFFLDHFNALFSGWHR